MIKYLLRRLAFAVFLVFAVSSASLVLARLAPGDYAAESLGVGAHPETVVRTRARLGLMKLRERIRPYGEGGRGE